MLARPFIAIKINDGFSGSGSCNLSGCAFVLLILGPASWERQHSPATQGVVCLAAPFHQLSAGSPRRDQPPRGRTQCDREYGKAGWVMEEDGSALKGVCH